MARSQKLVMGSTPHLCLNLGHRVAGNIEPFKLTAGSRLAPTIAPSGDERAWGRRLMMVNFEDVRPVRPIPDFAEKLVAEEASGILNWLVEGAKACRKEMDKNGFLTLTARQKQRVADLLHDSDSVRSFVENCVREKLGGDVTSEELLLDYYDECEKQNWTPVSSHEFQTRVPDILGLKFRVARRHDIVREGRAVRGFKGIVVN